MYRSISVTPTPVFTIKTAARSGVVVRQRPWAALRMPLPQTEEDI